MVASGSNGGSTTAGPRCACCVHVQHGSGLASEVGPAGACPTLLTATSYTLHPPTHPPQEKPGLRLMQYKSMIFERWQKDPRNPRNQRPEGN